jgi:hypothetical protein
MNIYKPTLNMWFLNIVVTKSKDFISLNIKVNNILKINIPSPLIASFHLCYKVILRSTLSFFALWKEL